MFQGSLGKFSPVLWRGGVLGSCLPGLLGTAARFTWWRHGRVPGRSSWWLSVVRGGGSLHARLDWRLVGLYTQELVRLLALGRIDDRHVSDKRNVPRTSGQVNIHWLILEWKMKNID